MITCGEPLVTPIPAAHPEDPAPRRGGVVRFASFGDARTFDPAAAADGLSIPIINLMFAGLVTFDDEAKVVPEIAERWEVLEEGHLYRFHLKQGVRFHDGDEVTADDVKRSVERALHPTTPNPMASFFENIAGYEAFTTKKAEHLSGVTVEGKYVVSFRLSDVDAAFLPTLALTALRPVCKSAKDRYSDTWHPCGAGMFKLPPGGFERGTRARVVRHDGYFEAGLPYLDAVEFLYQVNVVTQRFKFEAGQLDLLRDLSQADLVRFQNDARWKAYGMPDAVDTNAGESMNTRMAPFDNVELRRAVAAAIDREHYRLMKPGNVDPAFQPVPTDVPGHSKTARCQKFDLAAAREHMKKAGYPDGYPRTIEYVTYPQGLPEYTAQVLQQELAQIGIRLELKLVSWPSYLATTHRPGKSVMSNQGWHKDYPDASSFFEPLFSTKAINEEETGNSAFYSNKELDELLEKGRHELDPEKRQLIYDRAAEIVCDDAPWAFTYFFHFYEVRQPYLRGYKPHRAFNYNVRRSFLDRAAQIAQVRTAPLRDVLTRAARIAP
jgi:ABC-type transport system substrate-binding protein